jgi:3-dehydroquinate synthase
VTEKSNKNIFPAIEQSFEVRFDYPVLFVREAFDPADGGLAGVFHRLNEGRRPRVAVCLDEGLAAARPDLVGSVTGYFHAQSSRLEVAGAPIFFPGGHEAKTGPRHLQNLIWTLGNLHLDRQSFVLAIGGGSMLDAVGLGASLIHRGVRLVRMPSTVLGQCDSGVGVKNGVDEHGQKNFLGVFAPPFAVVNDLALLDSLPLPHWLGGVAEAYKVALIRDADFFDFLSRHADALRRRERVAMEETVYRCAQIHLRHIATGGDPFEKGSARPLDFGHWSAHRLEIMSGYRIGHGQAVAVGMALDCCYAQREGLLTPEALESILAALEATGLPVFVPELNRKRPDGELELLQGLEDFREHLGGRLTLTLPDGIGTGVEIHRVNESGMIEGIERLRQRAERNARQPE